MYLFTSLPRSCEPRRSQAEGAVADLGGTALASSAADFGKLSLKTPRNGVR